MKEKADKTPEVVSYSTFVSDLAGSRVAEVDVYELGQEVNLTYETVEGELRATKGPIGLENDDLLSFTLESQEVPFSVHAEKYGGPGANSDWIWVPAFLLVPLVVPVLLILVILRQSKTIRTLGEALARASGHPQAEHDGDGKPGPAAS